jgi:hypothetical protein
VDVCRECIAFDAVRDVSACLRAIAADTEVVVARVKNRLDPRYDAAASGGYRDVNLNLLMHTREARRLGLVGHVCELQLVLRGVAEVKGAEGHRSYVMFRNLRVE